ncbi:MAG: hypothetical protein LC127_01680 [Chitinophagales bacterium]|nr:hypothetical protein [Chitinophagales bacterium]
MEWKSSEKYLNYCFWLIFIGLVGWFKFQYHELWKDEWQAWFVAKDKSLPEMLSFLYYEGHPALWYLYLKIVSIFSTGNNDMVPIQSAHLITVAAGLYFLLVKFRIPLLFKVVFTLSYFMIFEYGIINRGYYLVILFAFWAVWLLSKAHYNKKHLAWVLFFLFQTEVYGAIMALVLGAYALYDQYLTTGSYRNNTLFIGIGTGLAVFILSVFPRTSDHVARTASRQWDAIDKLFMSIQGNLSNTFMPGATKDTFTYGWTGTGLFLSVLCLAFITFVFYKNKKTLWAALLFIAGILVFSNLFFLGGIRQWGMGFVFFIALLQLRAVQLRKDILASVMILVFGVFNLIHGFKALKEDFNIPFTNAATTGAFIKEKVPQKVPVVALNKFDATPVIGYAGRKFYELPDGVEFSYFRWVDKIYIPTESELKQFAKYKNVGGLVLLSPQPIDTLRYLNAQFWEKFTDTNYKNENYYLYQLPDR